MASTWACALMHITPHRRAGVLLLGVLLLASLALAPSLVSSPSTSAASASSAHASSFPAVTASRSAAFRPTILPGSAAPTGPLSPLPALTVGGSSALRVPAIAPAVTAPSSPVIRASWNGLGSSDNANLTPYPSVSPPDVQMAVGPTHVVEMVNLAVTMWTKQGVRVHNSSLMDFFGTPTAEFISDPKVQYDASSGRWFATITDVATSTNVATGQVILAVSAGSNPTGAWRLLKVPSTATGQCLDQPILGVGALTVIVSVNVFSSCLSSKFTYSGAEYWALSKADLVSNASSPAIQSFGPFANTASYHPAQVIGASTADYLVTANAFNTSVSSIELFRVTGTPPSASVSVTSLSVRTIANPPAAPQPGNAGPLDTGDFRVLDAAWSAGNLWLSLGDSCIPTGDNQARSCVRLVEVNTTTSTITQDFDVGAAGRYYLYPSLRADGRGNLLVVFGYSSSTDYPGLMAAGRVFGDPLGQLDPPAVIMAGATDQTLGCAGSGPSASCRYGDYFGASLDPSDDSVVWAAGEFGVSSGWGTQIFAGSVKAVLTFDYSIVNGGTGYSLPMLAYTLDGASRTTALTVGPTSYAADPGTGWSVPVILFNPHTVVNPTYEAWVLNASAGNPPFNGTVNMSFTATFVYFHMFLFRFGFAVSDNATGPVPMIQVVAWGFHVWAPADASYYVDANSNFTYPALLNESTTNERWILRGPSQGTVTGPNSFAGLYYHQYRMTFDYRISSGASGPAPSVRYYSEGTNTSVQANATVWADAAFPFVYLSSLTAEGGGVRIGAGSGATGNVTTARTITVTYSLQYLLRIFFQPGALAGNVSGAGWYDAGGAAIVTATAPTGWKFMGWFGDASGTSESTTVMMSHPSNVTALFYPGLTIVAGNGGSIRYSTGNASGTVAAGDTFVLYAPVGTSVTLVAQPSSWTDTFSSWGGDARGTAAITSVTLAGPMTASAAFGSNVLLVAGSAVGVIAVLLAAFMLLLVARRRKKNPPA